jgi:hypothetical protein
MGVSLVTIKKRSRHLAASLQHDLPQFQPRSLLLILAWQTFKRCVEVPGMAPVISD